MIRGETPWFHNHAHEGERPAHWPLVEVAGLYRKKEGPELGMGVTHG